MIVIYFLTVVFYIGSNVKGIINNKNVYHVMYTYTLNKFKHFRIKLFFTNDLSLNYGA